MLTIVSVKQAVRRPGLMAVVAGSLIVGAGALVALPQRAAADYQRLPATSPSTWSYSATLATLKQRSSAAAQASSQAAAAAAPFDSDYAAAKKALADAQAKEAAATAAQAKAKATLAKATSSDEKARSQSAYNKAIGARYAAVAYVKKCSAAVSAAAAAAEGPDTSAKDAAVALTLAQTRVSRLQVMYGTSPTTAFTKLRSTYAFTNNFHRPDSSLWSFYDTSGTAKPDARDVRYIGIYNNALEATSWGTIGSGACLCRGSALPTTPYGRWEVRARVNRNADHGVAMLLWPNERTGPESGEIDMGEFNQNRTQANFALHYDAQNLQVQSHVLGDYTKWHTYRVDWNSRGIAWYIDNNLYAIVTDKAAIPTKPFHLVLQAGPNSSKSKATSTTLYVSGIKVFAP